MLTESQCKNARCVIFGSAPDIAMPDIESDDVIMCANGGARIALDLGLSVNVLATTTHLYRDGKVAKSERETRRRIDGIQVGTLWVDTKSHPTALVKVLGSIKHDEAYEVNDDGRSEIINAACGEPLWVSTGVFLVCLATISGASDVIAAGISLVDGHHKMPWDDRRDHVDEDRRAMELLGMPC